MIDLKQYPELKAELLAMGDEDKRLAMRDLCKRDLFFLSEYVLRNVESEPCPLNPEYHGDECDWLMKNKRDDGKILKRRMLMAPRGTLKSTVSNRNYVIWRIINNCNITILINSATLDNSKKKLRTIQDVFMKNKVFQWLFPELIPSNFNHNWTQTEMLVPRTSTDPEFTVEVQSVEGELTSRHYDLILDDDVVGKENSSTSEQIKKVINYYTQSLQLLKKPHGERLVIGTLWNWGDLHNHILEKLYKQFDFYIRSIWKDDRFIKGADGKWFWVTAKEKRPIYPEMQTMEDVLEMKDEIIADPLQGISTWMAQYELKIVDDETAKFKRKMVEHENFYFEEEDLYDKPLAFSLALDPASGEAKHADDFAFTVRALDQEGRWYLIDCHMEDNMDEDKVIDKYIEYLTTYPIALCTMEGVSAQRIYKSLIEKRCLKEGVSFPYMPLPAGHNNANKNTSDLKILGMAPIYAIGNMSFKKGCPHTEKLLDQLWRFPKAAHDDGPDSLSMHLHLPIMPTRIWKTKEIRQQEKPTCGRYGEKLNNKQSSGYYI